MDTIQATLFDTYKKEDLFTLEQAVSTVKSSMDVKIPSIRARIYEGIDRGIFERISRGVYRVDRNGQSCLCILGNGRDLSMIEDNSIDAIVTDHPYSLDAALNGGNRHFAEYDKFRYSDKDFKEKARVLKDGSFLCEFVPEESEINYQYLYDIKEMAKKAGLTYYAKVPWKKGDFVANTGRKSKNTEDILFFTKGKARNLRPDVKKNLAEPSIDHRMSGTAKMLPTVFDFQPPQKAERIHQAEKPVSLLAEILEYITLPGELVLDQFAGSGNLGIAALLNGRSSILIETDDKTYQNLKKNINQRVS